MKNLLFVFIGGGFGHDENIFRPNYFWLEKLGHNGGVHNSYFSIWFAGGIIGVLTYFGGLFVNVFKSMKNSYLPLAFLASILFNITYESWLIASLNPFVIIYLIILTIFVAQIRGKVATPTINRAEIEK